MVVLDDLESLFFGDNSLAMRRKTRCFRVKYSSLAVESYDMFCSSMREYVSQVFGRRDMQSVHLSSRISESSLEGVVYEAAGYGESSIPVLSLFREFRDRFGLCFLELETPRWREPWYKFIGRVELEMDVCDDLFEDSQLTDMSCDSAVPGSSLDCSVDEGFDELVNFNDCFMEYSLGDMVLPKDDSLDLTYLDEVGKRDGMLGEGSTNKNSDVFDLMMDEEDNQVFVF